MCACSDSTSPQDGAIVTFAFAERPGDTLRAHVTREATIAIVEQLLSGEGPSMMPIGPIRRGAGADSAIRCPWSDYPIKLDRL